MFAWYWRRGNLRLNRELRIASDSQSQQRKKQGPELIQPVDMSADSETVSEGIRGGVHETRDRNGASSCTGVTSSRRLIMKQVTALSG